MVPDPAVYPNNLHYIYPSTSIQPSFIEDRKLDGERVERHQENIHVSLDVHYPFFDICEFPLI